MRPRGNETLLLATTQKTIRHKCGGILAVWRRSAVPTTALTRADFFANRAIDRVLNPVKSTKIHSHYALVAAKHERCSVGQSTCVYNHSITNTSSASARLRPPSSLQQLAAFQ